MNCKLLFEANRKKTSLSLLIFIVISQMIGVPARVEAQSSQVWSDPVNISNSGAALKPVIVAGENGVVHAVWNVASGGFRYSSSNDGITWTPSRIVLFPFVENVETTSPLVESREYPYRLIMGADGVINIFWVDAEGDLMLGRANSEQFPVPSSWAGVERLGESVLNFDVDITAAGIFHVTFARNDEKAGIYYRRSPNGALWTEAVNLYSSQYITSMKYADTHVRVSASDDPESPIVLVGWDVRPLKRIFLATSSDGGLNFPEIRQFKGPEDTGGYGTPFNIEIGVVGGELMLTWQVGEPGATQCTIYSQSSTDAGQTWSDPSIMLDARSLCPEQLKFLKQKKNFFMLMLNYKGGNPAILVWNGTRWGGPQVQNELSSFVNSQTFDPILFGCKNETLAGNTLYLAGCDQGAGRDIWITSRSLEPIEQWSGNTPLWSYPTVLAIKPKLIANVSQVSEKDRIHAVWTESSQTDTGSGSHSIYYSQLDHDGWSTPNEMIKGLIGKPGDLTMAVGNQGKLFIVWTDEQGGSLVYTAVNSDRAELRTEWADPRGIPTITRINSSPDLLVDASGKVVVVYSVPINEGRGIYLIEANGREHVWSLPVQVFDAVAAEWEQVNYPEIGLTGDGRLHLLFSRVARQGDIATALYYSQSSDGGATWSVPELIREGSIIWSEIVSYDGSVLHRLWQEERNGVVSNFHQVSRDSGITWESALEVTGVLSSVLPVALAVNNSGDMHFLRLVEGATPRFVKEYELVLEDWQWDGDQWNNQASQKLTVKGDRANYFLTAGITAGGRISALISADYFSLDAQHQSQIVGTERQTKVNNPTTEPFFALIPTTEVSTSQPTEIPGELPIQEPLPNESFSLSQYRNLAGIILIAIVVAAGLYFARRRAGAKS